MLLLITAWTLLTVASALGLLALLAVDEWQVRARTPFRSVSVQPAASGTAVDAFERPHAAGVLVAA